MKMHSNQIDINLPLVQKLIAQQFPQWTNEPLRYVQSSGTDHALYRLGEDKVVRLPLTSSTVEQVYKEQRWLPHLAPALPLAIPSPLALGEPTPEYPHAWSVYSWLSGENPILERIEDLQQFVEDLSHFLRALHEINTTDAPAPGGHNIYRGVHLQMRDDATRRAIQALGDAIDARAMTHLWEASLEVDRWQKSPVWIHGDLQASNMLIGQGRLKAVIDFGGLAIGDPASDLQISWNFLPAEYRASFRERMQVDDATWLRGRGWALSIALIALPYYQHTNPAFAHIARHTLHQILEA